MKRVGILLITVALIAGMAGCGQPAPSYNLTIASTVGGSVTTPGEGVFTYDEGMVVDLVATPEAGYLFGEWTGNVSTIADVDAAVTNITINSDYSIIAEFEEIPTVQYDLAMAADPEVGGTATDLTGESPYAEGTEVSIRAEANEGYEFVNWTAPVGGLGDANVAETTFTMPAQNVTVTANFGSVYGDYSDILENVLTSRGDIELPPGTNITPSEGEHAPVDNYEGPWPPPEELKEFYAQNITGGTHYYEDTEIDLDGVDIDIGPLYVDGELDIVNSSNTPATLTLTGTIYVTGDTLIGKTGKHFTLDLNGQTLFVASDSSDPQRALWIGGQCTIEGPGVIVAIGDIYFEPEISPGMTAPIFLMSVSGENLVQPGGDFYGSIAGSVEVQLQPGTSINYPDNEAWYEGFNFLIGI